MADTRFRCYGSNERVTVSQSSLDIGGGGGHVLCGVCGRAFYSRARWDSEGWPVLYVPRHLTPQQTEPAAVHPAAIAALNKWAGSEPPGQEK